MKKSGKSIFLKWEMLLVYILLAVNLALAVRRPDLFFKRGTITAMIQSGLNICPLVMGMSLVMMLGDVDVSCTANMIFCAMVTGLLYERGVPAVIAIAAACIVGIAFGALNGFLIAYVGLPAVITTISMSLVYRGACRIILGTNVLRHFPAFYSALMWRDIGGIPYCMIAYFCIAIVFAVLLHRTRFGRRLYMIGNNATTTFYSGIDVKRTKLYVFMIMGFMAAITSIFYIGRLGGGAQSAVGSGDEMTVIAITALGGIAANGGKGKIYGPVIATFIVAALSYFLNLLGIDDNGRKIFIGAILILAVFVTETNENKALFIKKRNS